MRFIPHDYQKRAIDMIMKNPACGLFLEMGLGKTVISLTAAERLIYHEFEVSRVLVIAPLKVAEDTWSRESEKWDHLQDLKIVKILGNLDKRLAAAKDDADIYVVNRENVVWLAEMYPGKYWKWDMVIIDELSSFKSSSTMRFKAMRSVRPYIDRIVGLTGTPNPNGYMDLWAQIFLLDQGKRLERTIGGYRQKYFRPGRGNGHITYEWLLLPGADKAIQEKISDIAVSMKAEDYLKLPDRIENEILVTLPPDTLKRYRELEKEHLLELQDPDATITAANAAAVMNKLLQLTGGAVYDDEGGFKVFHDEKIKALKDIIDTAGGPVLVFYGYRHERDRLQKDLTKLKPRELQKEKDIDDWNAGKVKVLIAHPASVGYGLNLQAGGHVIVWYSIPWSLELYQQANARLHRQGQTETVVINHLVAVGTVDKQVMAALKKKDMSQSALMTALKERINENW
jgi:SNF2 family DNA or RNA helicase